MSTREFGPVHSMRPKMFTVAHSQPAKAIAGISGGGGRASGVSGDAPKEVVRSFRRLAAILGIGVAAVAVWYGASYAYRKYRLEKDESQLLIAEVADAVSDLAEAVADGVNAEAPQPIEVILHQCPRGIRSPCISPFPFKLETFLRVVGIPYKVDEASTITFGEANEDEHVPWLTINGNDIYDSQQCIPELCQAFGIDLDAGAPQTRLTSSHLVDSTLETSIYWEISLWRWVIDAGKSIPLIQRMDKKAIELVPKLVNHVTAKSKHNRFSRLSLEKLVERTHKDLHHIAVVLGRHPFFLGPSPGEVDCTAFALLCQMVYNMPDSPFEREIQKVPRLIKYVERMKSMFWPDWDDILQQPGIEETFSLEKLQHSEDATEWEKINAEEGESSEAELYLITPDTPRTDPKATDDDDYLGDDLGDYNSDEEAQLPTNYFEKTASESEMLNTRASLHSVESAQSTQSHRSAKSTTSNGFEYNRDYSSLPVNQDEKLKQAIEDEQMHMRQMGLVNAQRDHYLQRIRHIGFKIQQRMPTSNEEYAMYQEYHQRTHTPYTDQNGVLLNQKLPSSYYSSSNGFPAPSPRLPYPQDYFGYGQLQQSTIPSESSYQPNPAFSRLEQPPPPRPNFYRQQQMMTDNRIRSAQYPEPSSSDSYRRAGTAPSPVPAGP